MSDAAAICCKLRQAPHLPRPWHRTHGTQRIGTVPRWQLAAPGPGLHGGFPSCPCPHDGMAQAAAAPPDRDLGIFRPRHQPHHHSIAQHRVGPCSQLPATPMHTAGAAPPIHSQAVAKSAPAGAVLPCSTPYTRCSTPKAARALSCAPLSQCDVTKGYKDCWGWSRSAPRLKRAACTCWQAGVQARCPACQSAGVGPVREAVEEGWAKLPAPPWGDRCAGCVRALATCADRPSLQVAGSTSGTGRQWWLAGGLVPGRALRWPSDGAPHTSIHIPLPRGVGSGGVGLARPAQWRTARKSGHP